MEILVEQRELNEEDADGEGKLMDVKE